MTVDLFGSALITVRVDPATGALDIGAARQIGPPQYVLDPPYDLDLARALEPAPDPLVADWRSVETPVEADRIGRAVRFAATTDPAAPAPDPATTATAAPDPATTDPATASPGPAAPDPATTDPATASPGPAAPDPAATGPAGTATTATTGEIEVSLLDEGTVGVVVHLPAAAAIRQRFVALPGERFLGFGERSHAAVVDRGVIENYVGEGPYQPHEYPFLTDTVPPWGIRNRPDATYFPLPWVLSTRGYGILIDEDGLSYERFRVDDEEEWSVEVEGSRLSYRVFAGPTPLEVLRRFTAATGRQPAPERWFFGPWYQSGHANHVPLEEERRQLDVLGGAAVSAVETHCRYLPLGEDRGHEESERARTDFFHSAGKAVLSYLNPLVGREYPEAFDPAAEAGALPCHAAGGEPYVFRAYAGGRVPPHTDETHYDFTHPAAEACWEQVAERVMDAGYDGWMEDFGEYTPLDAIASDRSTGIPAHNRYPTAYHTAAAAVARRLEEKYGRRLARFVRSGWSGTAAAVPIVWGGDPTTSWGFDGLASAVVEGLSMGASGLAVWGSDTGGFLSTIDQLTPELLRRWIQFAAFSPVMRTKAGGIEIPEYERPQIWDDDIRPTWERWAGWHLGLNDYLMAAYADYRDTGRPIMCAVELAEPDIGPTPDDQYLFGPDLLVAPVLEPDARTRTIAFPAGRWRNLFSPAQYFDGPVRADVEVGPDDIPVYARAGSVLALLPAGLTSVSPYAPPVPDRRTVLVFGTGRATANPEDRTGRLGPDHAYRIGQDGEWWTLRLEADRPFTWDVTVHLDDAPAATEADGDWAYDESACELRGTFSGTVQILRLRAPSGRSADPPS